MSASVALEMPFPASASHGSVAVWAPYLATEKLGRIARFAPSLGIQPIMGMVIIACAPPASVLAK
jgi:hypothetical protein